MRYWSKSKEENACPSKRSGYATNPYLQGFKSQKLAALNAAFFKSRKMRIPNATAFQSIFFIYPSEMIIAETAAKP